MYGIDTMIPLMETKGLLQNQMFSAIRNVTISLYNMVKTTKEISSEVLYTGLEQ